MKTRRVCSWTLNVLTVSTNLKVQSIEAQDLSVLSAKQRTQDHYGEVNDI